jgi:hypothetical protein
MPARTIEVNVLKRSYWGHEIEPESFVEPKKIPDRQPMLVNALLERYYPGWSPINLGRDTFYGEENSRRKIPAYSLFFKTMQDCFNDHLPFALRPEVLWYLIIHEVATAVRLNPEKYRDYFTESDEKETITVLAETGRLPTEWVPYIEMFASKIQERMPRNLRNLVCSEYSTSTLEASAATNVAFMEASSPFYDYRMRLLCGLPLIRLEGEADDYAKLASNANALKEMFSEVLGPYFTHLIPVLDKIADQAAGAPVDHEFWGSICNHDSGSGGSDGSDDLGGWITAFLNYVRIIEGRNIVKVEPKSENVFDWSKAIRWLSMGMVPNHVSSADFLVEDLNITLKLVGGVLGVDVDDGFVSPKLSYGVLTKEEDSKAIDAHMRS